MVSRTNTTPTMKDLLLYEYRNKREFSEGYPLMLTIESTNNCNLKCVMCPREFQTAGRGFIDYELFRKAIDESAGLTKFIWLHYMGEPLMNPRIFDMIDYASNAGMKVGLSTNGTMFTAGNIDRLLQSKLYLAIISIDANTKEVFGKVRGEEKYFDRIESSTRELLTRLTETAHPMFVSIQFIKQTANEAEHDLFVEKWSRFGIQNPRINLKTKGLTDWGSQFDYTELGLSKSQFRAQSCTEPYRTLIINWNGSVSACCFDYNNKYNLGNVNSQTVQEIWNGAPMQALRKSFVDKQAVGICGSCSGINSDLLFEDEFAFYTRPD